MAKQTAVENNSGENTPKNVVQGNNNSKNVVQGNNNSKNVAQESNSNLFIKVDTFNEEGREIGTRIVDLYHYGTRSWLYDKHLWWATHNKATVEIVPATSDEINAYVAEQKLALADKFNTEKAHVAA